MYHRGESQEKVQNLGDPRNEKRNGRLKQPTTHTKYVKRTPRTAQGR